MESFVSLAQANGVEGLFVALIVLVAVFAMSKGGVVVTGNEKRVANVALSILLAGVSLVNPEQADVVVGAIATIGSALLYELIKFSGGLISAKG